MRHLIRRDRAVLVTMAFAAVASALLGRALAAAYQPGAAQSFILLELLIPALALAGLARGKAPLAPARATVLVAGLCILVPSVSFAWLAVFLLGADAACRASDLDDRRHGLVLALLAATELAAASLLKLLSGHLLAAEAALAAGLLQALGLTVLREANLLVHGDHELAVLLGCSGVINAMLAALAWLTLAPSGGPVRNRLLLVALLAFALNTARLTVMATSMAAYAWMHGPWGAALFDICLIGLVILLQPGPAPAPAASALPSLRGAALILGSALLVLSLVAKEGRYAEARPDPRQLLEQRLGAIGFVREGESVLSTGGSIAALAFRAHGCSTGFGVVVLGATSEHDALLRRRLGGDPAIVAEGAAVSRVPTATLLAGALASLLGGASAPLPPLAVAPAPLAVPTPCAPSIAEWETLWRSR